MSERDHQEERREERKEERAEYLHPYDLDLFKQILATALLVALETVGEEMLGGIDTFEAIDLLGESALLFYSFFTGGMVESWYEGFSGEDRFSKEGFKVLVKGSLKAAILPLTAMIGAENHQAIGSAISWVDQQSGISAGISNLATSAVDGITDGIKQHGATGLGVGLLAAGSVAALKKAGEKASKAWDRAKENWDETKQYFKEREFVSPIEENPSLNVNWKWPKWRGILQKKRSSEGSA
jgi:hypothetical protein